MSNTTHNYYLPYMRLGLGAKTGNQLKDNQRVTLPVKLKVSASSEGGNTFQRDADINLSLIHI